MKIAIWGTGKYGKDLLKYLKIINAMLEKQRLCPIICECFFDNAAEGVDDYMSGIPVYHPEHIAAEDFDVLVVAVGRFDEILEQIKILRLSIPCVIYHPKRKIKFLYDLNQFFQGKDLYLISDAYREKLNMLEEILLLEKEKNLSCWEDMPPQWSEEDRMAALEETGDIAVHKKLYQQLRDNCTTIVRDEKVFGIYYRRFYNGGVERVIAQLMPMFLRMGFRVILITEEIAPGKEYPCPSEVVRVVVPNVEQDRFDWYRELKKLIVKYGINFMYLHDFDSYSVKSMALYYLIKQKIFTIIHVHQFYKRIANKELFVDTYCQSGKIIVLSRDDEKFWKRYGIPAQYVPNPINLDIRYMYHTKMAKHPTIIWVGRIDQTQKQVYDLVKIMQELVKIIPNARLKIVGKADDDAIMKELQRRVQGSSLEKNFIFCGFRIDPWEEAQDADVFIMTSSFEGFPMALMESKMAGLPAVVYRLPYLELLKDGKGYLEVEQNDVAEAARQVAKILQNRELQEKLSKEARESIEIFSRFNIERIWNEILNECHWHNDLKHL